MDGSSNPHDILDDQGREGAGEVPGRRGAGGLPPAGREDQRQAHRDRSSARCSARCASRTSATPTSWSASRSRRSSFAGRERASIGGGGRRRDRRAPAARHHEGVALDRVLHLGCLLPGDDQGAHRGGDLGQDGLPARSQGERDHGAPDPGRDRAGRVPAASGSRSTRRTDLLARDAEDEQIGAEPVGAPVGAISASACCERRRMRRKADDLTSEDSSARARSPRG